MKDKTVGVVLAGCGFLDGAEIHEATLTLLALDRAGVRVRYLAPNVDQMHVVEHGAGKAQEGATRNVLEESARIARGPVENMAQVDPGELDALVVPGGFGAAKNLCDFAVAGPDCTVHPDVARFVEATFDAGKPLGLMCIAPAIGAKVLGKHGIHLTIGTDPGTAAALEKMGAVHVDAAVDETVVDPRHKVVSTPAYMLGPSISHVAKGIDKLVEQVVTWL